MKKLQGSLTGSREMHVRCLWAILRPLVRFCLRHSLKLQDLLEACKGVFLEVAKEEAARSGSDMSASRLSVMTGVHRRDVLRLTKEEPPQRAPDAITRVIGQWQHDRRFSSKSGTPKIIGVEGKQSEFAKLVASVSRDLNPYAVLFELERTGAVERTEKGLKLKSGIFNPRGNMEEGFRMLGLDTEDFIAAVEENVVELPKIPNLHLKTHYDNIPAEALPTIRNWLIKEGSAFHKRARDFLSTFDRDLNPLLKYRDGRFRVAIGSFSRIEDCDGEREPTRVAKKGRRRRS